MMYTHFHFMHINILRIWARERKNVWTRWSDERACACTLWQSQKMSLPWVVSNRGNFSIKKRKTNKPILCAATAHKKTPPQIQKYILPKPFTKIKWNSTCSGRVGKKHTHTPKYSSESLVRKRCTLQYECNSVSVHDWHPPPPFLTVIYHLFAKELQFNRRELLLIE